MSSISRLATSMFIMVVVMLVGNGSVRAADSCNDIVVDQTAAQVLNIEAVQDAASRLAGQGADVRVRAFDSAPTGDLSGYLQSQMEACSSWRGPNGDVMGNLIVFFVSTEDEKSWMTAGGNWSDELTDEIDRIRSDHMNPEFSEGDFTEGFVAAIDETSDVLSGDTIDANEVGGAITQVLLTVAVLAAAGLAAIAFRRNRVSRREQTRNRASLRSRALGAKLDADSVYEQLLKPRSFRPLLALAAADLDDYWTDYLRNRVSRMERLIQSEQEKKERLELNPSRYDPKFVSSTEELKEIATKYETLLRSMSATIDAADELEHELTELKGLPLKTRIRRLEESTP